MRFTDFAKNDCNHYIFKDIIRIFVTDMGSVKISYEQCPLYLIDSGPLSEKDVKENKSVSLYINF